MPAPNPMLNCGNCLAFERDMGSHIRQGRCHRGSVSISLARVILYDNWCLEFISKPEVAEQMRQSVSTVIPEGGKIELKTDTEH